MLRTTVSLALLLTVAISARGQALDGFEKVLIPVYTGSGGLDGPGQVRFWTMFPAVYSDTSFRYWPGFADDGTQDQVVTVNPGAQLLRISPLETSDQPVGMPARLMYVDVGARDAAFEIKVDVLRPGTDHRQTVADLPVVRENEFLRGRSHLLLVPFHFWQSERDIGLGDGPELEVTFRHHLRVYDVDFRGDLEVIVRVVHLVGHTESRHKVSMRDGDNPSYPYYTVIVIEPKCYPISGALCQSYEGRIEIEPVDPSARYWAMLTSTNNRTHDFAVTVAKGRGF